jgi:arylformamidase
MFIYKNYDKKALDGQYNNRAGVLDFAEIVQQWEDRSEQVRRCAKLFQDVRYGRNGREQLDIFPAPRPGSPIQAFFHGGYWQAMDKRMAHFLVDGFSKLQVTTVFVNYPLAPQASLDEIVTSCRNAIVWLYYHVAEYGGDPKRIYVSGSSAGGHIVAMLMATNWKEFAEDLPQDLIKGGCAISGLFDLTPIQLCYVNDNLGMDEATAQRNSPILLSPTCNSPLIISVGELESDEFHSQSREFSKVWSQKEIPITQLTLAQVNHFTILEQLTDKKAPLNQAILQQMEIAGGSS